MENLISTILSNPTYLIITGLAIVIIIFLLIKKLFKILIYAFVLFIAFLTYIYLTGGSVKETIKDIKEEGIEMINTNK
jgi:energy-coupling factor transporter transmembrane protein EcfT